MGLSPMFVETSETAQEILVQNCLHVFAISILFYDHVITLDREIEYIWKRPKSTSSYYFFLNRYGAFISTIAVTVPSFTTLPVRSCKDYNIVRQILWTTNQGIICFLLSLRIYALYGRSRRIRTFIWGAAAILITVFFSLLLRTQKSAPAQGAPGCHFGIPGTTAIRVSGVWWSLFIYDALLFALTVSKTWTTRKSYTSRIPFGRILLRDGSVYFGVIALSNFANILTYYLCGPFLRGGLSTFSADISSTMMTHLMLNLHEAAHTGIHTTLEASRVELDTLWSEALDRRSLASRDLRTNPDEEGPDTWRTGNH